MSGIRSAGLIICLLMVLMAYLKQAIPKGKITYLMKAIVSVFILLSIVNGIREISWKGLEDFLSRSYSHSEEVLENTLELIETGLKNEFQRFMKEEELDAKIITVEIQGDLESFEIKKVMVCGKDRVTAQKLLAGRYQIGLQLIEVVDG